MLYSTLDVMGIISAASNIRCGDNPEYTEDTFYAAYPQFNKVDADGNQVIPSVVVSGWVKLANTALSYRRYRDYWEMAMGLFIAHWLTLYMQSAADPNDATSKIISAGLAKGVQTSKSAGDLSVSYDFSMMTGDFDGWGTYKYTAFGQQFITIARLVSAGGMCVW